MRHQQGFIHLIVVFVAVVVMALATGYFLNENNQSDLNSTSGDNQNTNSSLDINYETNKPVNQVGDSLTDTEVMEKFACDRNTDDERDTDIFCRYPELYREGIVSIDTLEEQYYCNESEGQYPVCTQKNGIENLKIELEKAASKLR